MIRGFGDSETELLFREGRCPARWQSFTSVAVRKLDHLDAAARLADLRAPPGNRLEALKGDRKGQYSIRINDQWRICFRWSAEGPLDVMIVDYH
ncbi:type II toxin-antitoxin system RelE/ParE family toxin [Rhodoplanes azumiensis]|uniref:Type II toxin-antitoxin system RelE/ParE family toxin n=1 Tax=Rhodoplanes azumiensis TaxID=1897628 RepID=A0ABW5AIM8_9BRAD